MSLDEALAKLAGLLGLPSEAGCTPILVMLAGSNGAGKSTFYEAYLAVLGLPFINADRIAAALSSGTRIGPPKLSGVSVDRAAQRLADEERQASIVLRQSFVTETVLSDPFGAKVAMLEEARGLGFETWLFFIGISSAELSLARVHERVTSRGGHDVPQDRMRSRFPRTLANLPRAVARSSVALLLDNDLPDAPYRFVALFENGRLIRRSERTPDWAQAVVQ